MQPQHRLLFFSTLTVLVSASPNLGATAFSSRSKEIVEWRIDLHNNNATASLEHRGGSDLGSGENEEFVVFSAKRKERHLRSIGASADLNFDTTRGRRQTKRASANGDNVFNHYGKGGKGDKKSSSYGGYYGSSSSRSRSSFSGHYTYSSSKGSKKGGKGGTWGVTILPTTQPTPTSTAIITPAPSPSVPLPPTPTGTSSPPVASSKTPALTKGPTVLPIIRQTSLPTPSPTTGPPISPACSVNSDGSYGAKIGAQAVIPFAYELTVFGGSPTVEDKASLIGIMEEGISNAILYDLFPQSCQRASPETEQKEVPQDEQENEEKDEEKQHYHVGSGLFPSTAVAQRQDDRQRSYQRSSSGVTSTASFQRISDQRHSRDRGGGRYLQQATLNGLSNRPKDQAVNVVCNGNGSNIGFECFPVSGQLSVYTETVLNQAQINIIKAFIADTLANGNLQALDNRILDISARDLRINPFPDPNDDDTPSPTLSPTYPPVSPPSPDGDDPILPPWAIVTAATAGVILLIVLCYFLYIRRRKNIRYSDYLSGRMPFRPGKASGEKYKPPPSNLNNNGFGRSEANVSSNSFLRPAAIPAKDFPADPSSSPGRTRLPSGGPSSDPPINPNARPGSNRQSQSGRQSAARPTAKTSSSRANDSNAFGRTSPTQTGNMGNSGRHGAAQSNSSPGRSSNIKSPAASAARKAAYGLGPIKSPASNKHAFKTPESSGMDILSGVKGTFPEAVSISGSRSVGEIASTGPHSAGYKDPSKRRPISSANSVSGYSATGRMLGLGPFDSDFGHAVTTVPSQEDDGDSDSDASEENITLSSSDRRRADTFGDPDNAFGDAANAFGVGMRASIGGPEKYSSSSSYEEEVDEEYEIEIVEDDEDDPFATSSVNEEFWDDEIVEEVVDDPDQPILAGLTSSQEQLDLR